MGDWNFFVFPGMDLNKTTLPNCLEWSSTGISTNKQTDLHQGRTNCGRQVAVGTKFCTVAPNICGSSARNLLHIILLTPIILRWLRDFWNMYTHVCTWLYTHVCTPGLQILKACKVYFSATRYDRNLSLKRSEYKLSYLRKLLVEIEKLPLKSCTTRKLWRKPGLRMHFTVLERKERLYLKAAYRQYGRFSQTVGFICRYVTRVIMAPRFNFRQTADRRNIKYMPTYTTGRVH
jgi:hypothetical protein